MRHEIVMECRNCDGTGLYVGMGERGGCAVVCHTCKGSGREVVIVEGKEFTSRKHKPGVKVVFETNPGICAAPDVVPGGVPYDAWLKYGKQSFGDRGHEMRQHTCPCWWYQSANCERKPKWDTCKCLGRSFSGCKHFPNKAKCWERFDEEKL